MKRLIWSAFALSLTLVCAKSFAQTESVDDFLGLETEVMPDLEGPQRFTPSELHEKPEWQVTEKDVILDQEPLKGQGYSIIPWRGIEPEDFLSIGIWMRGREIKDVTPDWQIRLRDQRHLELMGKVLKCVGICAIYRGTESVLSEHLSRIVEGDELRTGRDSYAWVYLMDGSLVRVGAHTSLSFHEMLISQTEIFTALRLNIGHVFVHPRSKEEVKAEFSPETDSIFLPLMIREANLEWFERKRFASQSDREHLNEVLELKELAVKDQVAKLNELKLKNNEQIAASKKSDLASRIMVVAPNATVTSTNASFNMIHVIADRTWFRRSSANGNLALELRGYNKVEGAATIENQDAWTEVDPTGRLAILAPPKGELDIAELLTKRIQTIELAREIWMEKFTLPVLSSIDDVKKLGIDHGYRRWEEADLKKRQEFLSEYTRRIETTNLRSVENLMTKLEAAGTAPKREMSSLVYQKALDHYLLGLKKQHTQKKMRVREMDDLRYYVYLLRNGKL